MPNRWIQHVQKYAREHNMKYSEALADPNVRQGYQPVSSAAATPATPVKVSKRGRSSSAPKGKKSRGAKGRSSSKGRKGSRGKKKSASRRR